MTFKEENEIFSETWAVCVFDKIKNQELVELEEISVYFAQGDFFKGLEEFLGLSFKKNQLLFETFTHTSFANEFPHLSLKSNERLEFLGDSILGAIVTTLALSKFPDLSEGKLSKLRSSTVNEDSLADLAIMMNLGDGLLLGRGEILSRGMDKRPLLANLFEALIGFIYLEHGFEKTKESFLKIVAFFEEEKKRDFFSLDALIIFDAKSILQEKTMALFKTTPNYQSENIEDGQFEVKVIVEGKSLAMGTGPSKKKLERELAKKIIQNNLLDTVEKNLC